MGSSPRSAPPAPPAHHPIGVMGGTFDPIHFGHLRMAEELASALALDEVRFIPAGQPPHRAPPRTDAAHRLQMTRLAIAGNPRFVLDEREVREARASYTVDTLTALRQELGEAQPLWLLLGADAFLGLSTWKDWRHLFDLAHLAVAHRPSYRLAESDALPAPLAQELAHRLRDLPATTAAGTIVQRPVTALDISATAIRQYLGAGVGARYLLPDSVLDYIRQHRLYA